LLTSSIPLRRSFPEHAWLLEGAHRELVSDLSWRTRHQFEPAVRRYRQSGSKMVFPGARRSAQRQLGEEMGHEAHLHPWQTAWLWFGRARVCGAGGCSESRGVGRSSATTTRELCRLYVRFLGRPRL